MTEKIVLEHRHDDYGEDAGGYCTLWVNEVFVGRVESYEARDELKKLAQRVKELEQENERLNDLVRYERHHLHEAELLSDEEYAALVADSQNGQRVARLEGYDKLRKENERLKAPITIAEWGTIGRTDPPRSNGFERANRVIAARAAQKGDGDANS